MFAGSAERRPSSIPAPIVLGNPDGEAQILALGHAYQGATDFHRRQPVLPG
jgi:hypothetical protein